MGKHGRITHFMTMRYGKLIIEEGACLKLAKEGRMDGQENTARAVGLLGRNPENVGVCLVFEKLLKEGHIKVGLRIESLERWADRDRIGSRQTQRCLPRSDFRELMDLYPRSVAQYKEH
ncbi:hypothetical protein L6452_19193 [Arctium lappa]|uniref:Uncharacterized protein n=1 Tax=Arctium lappa TaxID=4217 RepID=A0ACB9B8R7_ARCLA|nr:hypothetical protein L6452_19193 [Arctium lappa]